VDSEPNPDSRIKKSIFEKIKRGNLLQYVLTIILIIHIYIY